MYNEKEEREEDGRTGRDGMHSKREPTHRRVVGKMKDSGGPRNSSRSEFAKIEPRIDLSMGRKNIEIPLEK